MRLQSNTAFPGKKGDRCMARIEKKLVLIVCALLLQAPSLPAEQPLDEDTPAAAAEKQRNWYLSLGSSNSYPRMKDAEARIDNEVNGVFRLVAPGFKDVKTFSDQRDDMMIWTPFLSVGRKLSEYWAAFAQVGYTAGSVHSKGTDFSWLLLPLHTDITFKRSSFFAGLGIEWYPWGMAELRKYESLAERFKNAKPFLGTSLNWNYQTADAKVKAGLWPLGNFVRIKQHEVWTPWSSGFSAGLTTPLGPRSRYTVNITYNLYHENGDDFSGPSCSFYWQWQF